MKKYLVVVYDFEIGYDDNLDYSRKRDAIAQARRLLRDYESTAVLDLESRRIVTAYNGFPTEGINF